MVAKARGGPGRFSRGAGLDLHFPEVPPALGGRMVEDPLREPVWYVTEGKAGA